MPFNPDSSLQAEIATQPDDWARGLSRFGEVPEGLADQVRATGAHFEHRDIDPMADLVRVHRLCLAKARQVDVDPDNPRHLSRSIVLTGAGAHG